MGPIIDNTAGGPSIGHGPGAKRCTWCGRSFAKASHLLRHVRSHAQEKPFHCPTCRKAFARTDALHRHQRTVHRHKSHSAEDSKSLEGMDEGDDRGDSTSTVDAALTNGDGLQSSQEPSSSSSIQTLNVHNGVIEEPMSPFQAMPSVPTLLSAFPTSVPASDLSLDDLMSSWLSQDGGALAAENALTQLFSDASAYEQITDIGGGQTSFASDPFQYSANSEMSWNRRDLSGSRDSQLQSWPDPWGHGYPPGNPFAENNEVIINSLPPRSSHGLPSQSPGTPQTRLTADTWESGIPFIRTQAFNSASHVQQPSRITSPEQVVNELRIDGNEVPHGKAEESVIPSMTFLDSCLHLYFRDFHPAFPILHKPAFQRDRTAPLLLLSMCSIGCMFIGTQAAKETGLKIYERLHYVIVFTRDSKMATEATRIAVTMSALLGQCFSFLYGQPRQMLTAEAFHGTLCTMARRSGMLKLVSRDLITYAEIQHLDNDSLEQSWRQWGGQESLRRVGLGLTIHAAELTAYSGLPRLVPAQLTDKDRLIDALFQAEDAQSWRDGLMQLDPTFESDLSTLGIFGRPVDGPDIFLVTVTLAQTIVNIHSLQEIRKTGLGDPMISQKLESFYDVMLRLSRKHNLLPVSAQSGSQSRSLVVLWHYTCVVRLSPIDLIEETAGRVGKPGCETVSKLQQWVNTPAARLAMLHCGHILHHAIDLQDLAFLLPRAIFQASLILFSHLTFVASLSELAQNVDMLGVTDWGRLAILSDTVSVPLSGSRAIPATNPFDQETVITTQEQYVAHGVGRVHLKGIIEGREPQLDVVTLRSTATRLLRRCTPWGIGDTLGTILSNVSF